MTIRSLAAVPILMLAACGMPNRGLESVHQPVVQRADYAFDVATDGGSLSEGEATRLAGWMGSLDLRYGDRVALDAGGGDAAAIRRDVAQAAGRFGILVSDDVPISSGALTPGTARVVVSRMRASVPGCPDHSRASGIDFNSNTGSNYGCATNANLAAMVARPEDLVRGRAGTRIADPATAGKAIEQLRKATPTGAAGLSNVSTRQQAQ